MIAAKLYVFDPPISNKFILTHSSLRIMSTTPRLALQSPTTVPEPSPPKATSSRMKDFVDSRSGKLEETPTISFWMPFGLLLDGRLLIAEMTKIVND